MMQAILASLPSNTVFSSSTALLGVMAGPDALLTEALAEADADLLPELEQPASIALAPTTATAIAPLAMNERLEII